MNDNITLPRSVVEQALEALDESYADTRQGRALADALRAALEQPHVDRKALRDEMWEKAMKLVSEATKLEREACYQIALTIGDTDAGGCRHTDAVASAIRERGAHDKD